MASKYFAPYSGGYCSEHGECQAVADRIRLAGIFSFDDMMSIAEEELPKRNHGFLGSIMDSLNPARKEAHVERAKVFNELTTLDGKGESTTRALKRIKFEKYLILFEEMQKQPEWFEAQVRVQFTNDIASFIRAEVKDGQIVHEKMNEEDIKRKAQNRATAKAIMRQAAEEAKALNLSVEVEAPQDVVRPYLESVDNSPQDVVKTATGSAASKSNSMFSLSVPKNKVQDNVRGNSGTSGVARFSQF